MKYKCNKEKGITLLALIITIIVLLILAGISIGALTSNNNAINMAKNAKLSTEEAATYEVLHESYVVCLGKNKRAIVTEENLQEEINKTYPEAEVAKEDNKFIVIIDEKYYELDDENGDIEGPKKFEKIDNNPGDIKTDKDGNPLNGTTNPYEIWCIEDLVEFSRLVSITTASGSPSDKPFKNKKCLLMKDLNFNSIFSYANHKTKYSYNEEEDAYVPDENSETTIKELCTTGMGFIPIGELYDGTKKCYWGSFDGQGYTLSNIYINSDRSAALFGAIGGATIRNISVTGNITSTVEGGVSSGIACIGHSSILENCHNKAKIVSEGSGSIASGIFGRGSGITVRECSNEGEINSMNDSGFGISGTSGTIRNCKNTGNITGKTSSAGISGAGWGNGGRTIINCGNEGDITSLNGGAAGITCSGGGSNLYNCYNTGKVVAQFIGQRGGGHAGLAGIGTFNAWTGVGINCSSAGSIKNITGTNYSGSGLIMRDGSDLTNCYYLEGINSEIPLTPETGTISYVKTSANSEDMTSEKVVNALNQYIEDHKNDEGEDAVNTSEWLKWRVGENGLPELIFDF